MSERIFRHAMGKFATGVTIITTQDKDETRGMTANAFMSVSLDPKLITVSISNQANILSKITKTSKFAVNILSSEQKDISMHFSGQAKRGKEIEFIYVKDVPVVKDALVFVVCTVHASYKAGDHTLFIGKVQECGAREGNPLTFYGGKYGCLYPE